MRLERLSPQDTPDRVEHSSIGRCLSELFELFCPPVTQCTGARLPGEHRTNDHPSIRILEACGKQCRDICNRERPLATCHLPPILLLAVTGFEDGQKQAGEAPLAQAFEGFQRIGTYTAISVMQAALHEPCHLWRGPHREQLH